MSIQQPENFKNFPPGQSGAQIVVGHAPLPECQAMTYLGSQLLKWLKLFGRKLIRNKANSRKFLTLILRRGFFKQSFRIIFIVKGERSECHLPLTRKPREGHFFYLTFLLPMFEITTPDTFYQLDRIESGCYRMVQEKRGSSP